MFKKNRTNPNTTTATTHSKKGGLAMLAGGLPILLLALSAWAVALAGVSIIRNQVGESNILPYPDLGYTWFVVFYNLFVLLLVAVYLTGAGVGRLPIGSAAISGLLAVAAVLTILETRDWNIVRKVVGRSDRAGKGATTLFAGYISLAVLNGLLILILGNQIDSRRAATTTHTTHYAQPVSTAPGTTGLAHATTTASPQGVNVV